MKTGRIVSSKKLADYVLSVIEQNIYNRLLDYCKRRVVEVGLTTLALVGDQDLISNLPLARKNLARLKTLVYKYLVKRIPYLALATNELLQMGGRESVEICLQTSQMTSDFKYVDWEVVTGTTNMKKGHFSNYWLISSSSSYLELAAKKYPTLRWVERYCRYINYLCRKYCAPFSLHPGFSIEFDNKAMNDLYNKTSAQQMKALVPFTIRVRIKVMFSSWAPENRALVDQVRSGEVDNDSVFTGNNWHASNIIGVKPRNLGAQYMFSAQKIYTHLDKAISVLSHLTRKVYYETSAYSFRSNPDS